MRRYGKLEEGNGSVIIIIFVMFVLLLSLDFIIGRGIWKVLMMYN